MSRRTVQKSDEEIVSGIREVFEKLGFQVQQEADLRSNLRTDMIATKPGGPTYLIEVKGGSGEQLVPFAAVAQLSTYVAMFREHINTNTDVHAILSSSGIISPAIQQVSEASDILLVHIGKNGAEFLQNFRDALRKRGVPIPSEIQRANSQDFKDVQLTL